MRFWLVKLPVLRLWTMVGTSFSFTLSWQQEASGEKNDGQEERSIYLFQFERLDLRRASIFNHDEGVVF
jgi:hypothetical protein